MPHLATLTISTTWDGQAIPLEEQVTLRLRNRGEALQIQVEAPFHGDPTPPGPPGPTDGLWAFEVVELFLVGPEDDQGRSRYIEIELSPHGHYLVLQLHGRRNRVAGTLPLTYSAAIVGQRWSGRALLPWKLAPTQVHTANAYAIHGSGDSRRYLAWHPVPGPKPDFHRLELFPPWAQVGLSPRKEKAL